MAEYNMPQYILREFKVTDARVSPTFQLGDPVRSCRAAVYRNVNF